MKAYKIIEELELWMKPSLIDSWDNTGFQVGHKNQEVNKILIALDLDREILDNAIENNIDMIITHHPMIFKPITSITSSTYQGQLILDAIKNDIVIYNAHSNLDLAQNGVNDELAKQIKLDKLEVLSDEIEVNGLLYGYGRVGEVRQTDVYSFINDLKKQLEAENIVVYGDLRDKTISKVALCGGSGSGFIKDAIRHKADVYITGDIKYHDAQLAYENDLILIDASHYDTEKVILPVIKEYLDSKFKNKLEISIISESKLPKAIY